ncbi:hypothetical protein GC207_05650 [bacterium]|nr:hypothetical protein [bacterium]
MRRIIMGVIFTLLGATGALGTFWLYQNCVATSAAKVRVYVGRFELANAHLALAVGVVSAMCLLLGIWFLIEREKH